MEWFTTPLILYSISIADIAKSLSNGKGGLPIHLRPSGNEKGVFKFPEMKTMIIDKKMVRTIINHELDTCFSQASTVLVTSVLTRPSV